MTYTIQRRLDRDGDEFYVVTDDETRIVVDEFETIEAAREAVDWMP